MKKILFVFGGEKASGAEFVIERLVRNIPESNSYLLMAPGKYADQLKREKLTYELILNQNLRKLYKDNSPKLSVLYNLIENMLKINLFVLRFIFKKNVDVVHCNTLVPSIYLFPSLLITRLIKPKLKWIWSDHDLDYAGSKLMMKIAPKMVTFFHKTLVVSKAVLEKFPEKLHPKIEILYNGLDLDFISIDDKMNSEFRGKFAISQQANVFGIMGQIVPRKGVLRLIKVFGEEFGNQPDYTLLIAGAPLFEQDPYFQDCVKEGSKYNNIIFTGFLTNISAYYNAIDFLINNSSHDGSEPLGTTILEGMAYKKTVLVSNVGGSKEIVNSDEVGIVYEADSDSALKKALLDASSLSENEKDKITDR